MTTWKRTKPKWPASLGLLFVMALGMLLLSEVQVKAAATKVLYIVDSSGTNKTVTADDSGAGWSYAADTATLTLDGFDGSYIESDGDLKVVLKGTNRLTPDNDKNCVIKAGSGQITIDKSDDDETDQLVIENAAMTQGEFSAFWHLAGTEMKLKTKAFMRLVSLSPKALVSSSDFYACRWL